MNDVQHRDRLGSQSGFTLIELMITVVVFTIGLVAILGSVTSMAQQQRYADFESITGTHMNYLLEELQKGVADSGQQANIVGYDSDLYGTNLFNGPVTVQIPGLDAVSTVSMQETGVTTAETSEVEVRITVLASTNRVLTYSTSRLIGFTPILQ